jgi:CDP-glucose 4,6-dehydratase
MDNRDTLRRAWIGVRVCVTGASGFIGSNVCQMLVALGAQVFALVSPSRRIRGASRHVVGDGLTVLEADVRDGVRVRDALARCEIQCVVHLAGTAVRATARAAPAAAFDVNVRGTWTVLEAVRAVSSVRSLVVASTAYANHDEPYGASKACAEGVVRCYAASYGIPATTVRLVNVFGPGDLEWSRLIPGTVRALLADEAPIIQGSGADEHEFLYVDDAARALLRAAERAPEDGVRGEILRAGSGMPVRVDGLVQSLVRVSGVDRPPQVLNHPRALALVQADGLFPHVHDAAHHIDWRVEVPLADGLRRTWEWHLAKRREQTDP